MSETNPLEDCFKISEFRVILSVKGPITLHSFRWVVTLQQHGGIVAHA